MRFEPISHPSDVGLIAYGSDLKELFANSAFGMFSLMADLSTVKPRTEFGVDVSGEDIESLLVNWLNELIYLEDAKNVLLSEFNITGLTNRSIKAKVRGEMIDPPRHKMTRGVKAATYNQLKIRKVGEGWEAKIIFDV